MQGEKNLWFLFVLLLCLYPVGVFKLEKRKCEKKASLIIDEKQINIYFEEISIITAIFNIGEGSVIGSC